MRSTARVLRSSALLIGLWGLWLSSPPAIDAREEKDERAHQLTRSIYLPVEIKLCEHLRNAVLYQDEQPVSVLPAKRIFQFTYYPGLSRIEPSKNDLRVEGHRSDGSEFVGRLAVTPWGVFTASRRIELDMGKQLEKMKFQLDVRYQAVTLKMRCRDSCGRADTVASAAAGHASPLEQ